MNSLQGALKKIRELNFDNGLPRMGKN